MQDHFIFIYISRRNIAYNNSLLSRWKTNLPMWSENRLAKQFITVDYESQVLYSDKVARCSVLMVL